VTGSRGLLWRLFAVLAALLLPLAVSSAWLDTVVTDSDAYVDTVAPLADDEDVQEAVARTVEGATVAAVQDATGQQLDGARRGQVAAAVGLAIGSAEFETIWREANRTAHRQAIRILEDDGGRVDSSGRVVVQVGPVYDAVIRSLEQRGLVDASAVPSVQASIPLVKSSDLDRARSAYELLDAAGFWVPALWLVLVALALLVSTERRRATVWLAVGSIIGLLALVLGLVVARGVLVSELGSSTDDELVRSIWDVLVSPLYWTIGVGLAVSVVVLVLVAVLGRRRPRA
jgi:hypothetical protein